MPKQPKRYIAQWTDPITGKRMTVSFPTKELAAACKAERTKESLQLKAGLITRRQIVQRRQGSDCSKLIAEYGDEMVNRHNGEKHIQATDRQLNNLCRWAGFVQIADFDPAAATRALQKQRKAKQWGSRSYNGHVTTLRSFARWIVEQGKLESNPFAAVRRLPDRETEEKRPTRPLTFIETAALIDATLEPRRTNYSFRLWTGLRETEACKLRWTDIDFDQRTIHLPPSVAKNKSSATQPLTPELCSQLAALLARRIQDGKADRPIFPVKHQMPVWRHDLERAGIAETVHGKSAHPKSLRQTFVTMAVDSGVDPIVVQLLARHALSGGAKLTFGRYAATGSVDRLKADGLAKMAAWWQDQWKAVDLAVAG